MSFRPKYGLELVPLLKRLIPFGEIKPLAARLALPYDELRRVVAGDKPLPASWLLRLARALGEQHGAELLDAVLGLEVIWSPAPKAELSVSTTSAAVELDRRITAWEDAIDRQAPSARTRHLCARVLGYVTGWQQRHEDERGAASTPAAERRAA